MITCPAREFIFWNARKIEIIYERGLERKLYTSEWFTDGDLLGEDEGVHEVFELFRIVISSREICHAFDWQCAVEVEISRYDKSFVADEIIDRFDESFFGLKISLKDVNLEIVVFDVLFHEFAEFCDELRLLY